MAGLRLIYVNKYHMWSRLEAVWCTKLVSGMHCAGGPIFVALGQKLVINVWKHWSVTQIGFSLSEIASK